MSLISAFNRWRISRLEKKHAKWVVEARRWREEKVRLGRLAYYTDKFESPLKWGKLQNGANWAGHYERASLRIADQIAVKISALRRPTATDQQS